MPRAERPGSILNVLRSAWAQARGPGRQARAELMIYVATLICVEAGLIAPGHLLAGDIVDAALILVLVNVASDPARGGSAGGAAAVRAMRALAVVALIRVVGLGLPLHDASDALAALALAILVGAAALWVAPSLGLPRPRLVAPRFSAIHLWPVAAGLALGLGAYLLGAPGLWSVGSSGARVLLALAAAVVVAAVEEGVFRGLVQPTLQRAAGRVGFVAASALFTSTSLGIGPAALVLTFALAGVIFADSVARSGSLAGAVGGHIVLVIAAGALWPAILGRRHHASLDGLGTTVVLAIAMTAVAAFSLRGQHRASGEDDVRDQRQESDALQVVRASEHRHEDDQEDEPPAW